MNFFYTTIASIIHNPSIPLALGLFIAILYTLYLDRKIVALTKGKSGSSLEDIIKSCVDGIAKVKSDHIILTEGLSILDARIKTSIRNAKTMRYKAYDANGSNQSFSIALINEQGDGVVISSLHSRDRMSTFAKPLVSYKSTYELTEEELQVITEAKEEHGIANSQ